MVDAPHLVLASERLPEDLQLQPAKAGAGGSGRAHRAVVLDQQVAAVGLAHLGHVAFFGAYLRQRLQLLRTARLPIEARLIGNDLLARAHVQELVETLGAERLLHGIDETDGELGMAVGEERSGERGVGDESVRPVRKLGATYPN